MDRRDSQPRSDGLAWPGADRLTDVAVRAKGSQQAAPAIEDAVLVEAAAHLAQISEFDLFRAAWQQWYGVAVAEQPMEPVFALYLHERRVPGWVRHFARQVIGQADAGTLNRAALGLAGFRCRESLPDLSCSFTAEVLGCALLALIVILI